ncbi:MAG: Tim44/TimA family putative adaptor protein [Holosporales bacterium]|jgi:predicted lipid-binding transport protein (Tim44 family)|nr:Tim44/TimA family putative adaptor protein [Holosporales bacterium]
MFTIFLAILSFFVLAKLFSTFGKYANSSKKEYKNDSRIKRAISNGKIVNQKSTTTIEKGILSLQEKLSDFSPVSFLNKAEEIFDSIFNAFANSHHHTLKSVLTESLYEQFAENIKKREEKDLRQEILIKHNKTSIDDIQILEDKAKVSVSFDVSQMSAIINSNGVSFDNPQRIYRDIIHKWIFEKRYSNEQWTLSKTSSIEK